MTETEKRWRAVTIISTVAVLIAIALPYWMDQALWDHHNVQFSDPAGDVLKGTYYPGSQDAGVLLLEGFGSDQVTMRSLASVYAQMGFHVMTFDFSGHGRSPGTLSYDNAATPRLAYQAIAALGEFQRISGLTEDRIVFVGHSLGARVALQASTMGIEPAGLVLLGTEVNLNTNTQAEFFTGVSDADLGWVQALGPDNPLSDILLISGRWDDILTPAAADLLADKLEGTGSSRKLVIFPGMLHNYEVYSTRATAESVGWVFERLALAGKPAFPLSVLVRRFCWVAGYAGLIVALLSAARWVTERGGEGALLLSVTNVRRYLGVKLLLWLAALPVGAIFSGIFFLFGIGLPTFNLIYVTVIGGYGVLMWCLYRFSRVPGTEGGLLYDQEDVPGDAGMLTAAGITLLVGVLTAAYARTGWFYVFPLNVRLVWLALFSAISSVGFWIGRYEERMLKVAMPDTIWPRVLNTLNGMLPFFLYALFLAILGSLSGVVGAVQGLLVLGLVMVLGRLLHRVNKVTWVNALCQGVLLYAMILPQGVLFK